MPDDIYIVKQGDVLAKIAKVHGLSLTALLALNPKYKANPNDIDLGDRVVTSRQPAKKKRVKSLPKSHFTMARGQLTFDAEGMELPGNRYHSRVLHVPSATSGATIGRGYDMRERSSHEIREDLLSAEVSSTEAVAMSKLAGLRGPDAEKYIDENNLGQLEITPAQQKVLFGLVYSELEGDVIRICRKADVVERYGPTDWESLAGKVKDILVDLRYRGDYTGSTRQKIQRSTAQNDVDLFTKKMREKAFWVTRFHVPLDRFKRRIAHLGHN